MVAGERFDTRHQIGGIGNLAERDDVAVEIVVLVIILIVVMRAGSDIVFGGSSKSRTARGRQSFGYLDHRYGQGASAAMAALAAATRQVRPDQPWSAKRDRRRQAGPRRHERRVSWSIPVCGALGPSAARSGANRPAATASASASARTPSTVMRLRIADQSKALSKGAGRASPDVSIRIWSGRGSSASRRSTVGMKSSATVQQMQPLASSTMFSAGQSGMAQDCGCPHPPPEYRIH